MLNLLFFLTLSFLYSEETTVQGKKIEGATSENSCARDFEKYDCQSMIDHPSNRDVPREYFLNCHESKTEEWMSCKQAAGEEFLVGVISGGLVYGGGKGLAALGIATSAAVGTVATVGILGGMIYVANRVLEASNETCLRDQKAAMTTAWKIFEAYHSKNLANSYKASLPCVEFLSRARKKTRKILQEIAEKNRRHQDYITFMGSMKSFDFPQRNIEMRFPSGARTLSKREVKFLSALEELNRQETTVAADTVAVERQIRSLRNRFRCSSGVYLAKVACGAAVAIGGLATGSGLGFATGRISQKFGASTISRFQGLLSPNLLQNPTIINLLGQLESRGIPKSHIEKSLREAKRSCPR